MLPCWKNYLITLIKPHTKFIYAINSILEFCRIIRMTTLLFHIWSLYRFIFLGIFPILVLDLRLCTYSMRQKEWLHGPDFIFILVGNSPSFLGGNQKSLPYTVISLPFYVKIESPAPLLYVFLTEIIIKKNLYFFF